MPGGPTTPGDVLQSPGMTSSASIHRARSQSGMGSWDMVIYMVLAAILGGGIIFGSLELIERGRATKAAEYQEAFNNWYQKWAQAGATHNTSATNQGAMAAYLLSIMNSPASTPGIPRQSGEVWVNETSLKSADGASLAGSTRLELTRQYELVGERVILDSRYGVTFDTRGTKNRGEFRVVVIDPDQE